MKILKRIRIVTMSILLAVTLNSCRTKWFIGDDSEKDQETKKTENEKNDSEVQGREISFQKHILNPGFSLI